MTNSSASHERPVLNRLALAASLLVLSVLAATPATAGEPGGPQRLLSAADVNLDVTPAAQVLAIWKSEGRVGSGNGRSRSDALRIARALPYQTLRVYLRDQFRCIPTEAEVARAIEIPDSGICGVGLYPAYKDRDSIAAIVAAISSGRAALGSHIAEDVSRYLPAAHSWRKIRVWFLVASETMFDAATLRASADGDSVPVILINLTEILTYGATTRERMDGLAHVLAHEVFHAGLREAGAPLPGWADYRRISISELSYIRRVMVDEGLAHYIDWRERPGSDSLFTWKPSARESWAFSKLASACRRLRQPDLGRAERIEVLQFAGNGPLWSKYGAISGMFAAHRIEMALGRAALRRAIEAGPDEFVRTYRDVARRNPRLEVIPAELIP